MNRLRSGPGFRAVVVLGSVLLASCFAGQELGDSTDGDFYIVNEPVSVLYYWKAGGPAPTVAPLSVRLQPEPKAFALPEASSSGAEVSYVDENGEPAIPVYGGYQYSWEKYIPDLTAGKLVAPDETTEGVWLDTLDDKDNPLFSEEYQYAHSPALYPALDRKNPVAFYRVTVTRTGEVDAVTGLNKASRWAYVGVSSVLVKAVFTQEGQSIDYYPAERDAADTGYVSDEKLTGALKAIFDNFYNYEPYDNRLYIGPEDGTGLPFAIVRTIIEGTGDDSVVVRAGVTDHDVVLKDVTITKAGGQGAPFSLELRDASDPAAAAAISAAAKDTNGNARDPETSVNLYLEGENVLSAGALSTAYSEAAYAGIHVPGVVDRDPASASYQKWTQFARLTIEGGGGTLTAKGGSLSSNGSTFHGAAIGGNGGNKADNYTAASAHISKRLAGEIIIEGDAVVYALGGAAAEQAGSEFAGPTAALGGGSWYDPTYLSEPDFRNWDLGSMTGGFKAITIQGEAAVLATATSGSPTCCVAIGGSISHDGEAAVTIGGQARVIAAAAGEGGVGIGLTFDTTGGGGGTTLCAFDGTPIAYDNPSYTLTFQGDALVYAQGSHDDYFGWTSGLGVNYNPVYYIPSGSRALRVRGQAIVAANGVLASQIKVTIDTAINEVKGTNPHAAIDTTCVLLTENTAEYYIQPGMTVGPTSGVVSSGVLDGPVLTRAFRVSYTQGMAADSRFMGPDSAGTLTLNYKSDASNVYRLAYLPVDVESYELFGRTGYSIKTDIPWDTTPGEALAYKAKLESLFQALGLPEWTVEAGTF